LVIPCEENAMKNKEELRELEDAIWALKRRAARLRSGTNNPVDEELHDLEHALHESIQFIVNIRKIIGE